LRCPPPTDDNPAEHRGVDVEDDNSLTRTVDRLVGLRLRQFQQATGLPAVFGGATAPRQGERELRIGHARGTLGSSLIGLHVGAGRGLGGSALVSGVLRVVRDYASARAITHDFDGIVVQQERMSSLFALPIMTGGVVGGIVYGAVRGPHRIGDVVLERATAFGASLERELTGLLTSPAPHSTDPDPAGLRHARAAVGELTELARTTGDAAVRRKLDQLIVDLRSVVDDVEPAGEDEQRYLAPREAEVLRLVAVGMANVQVGAALGLSTETVRAYLRSAMRKLDVHNRTAAVHTARRRGLI
jgi:LuxR family transcriptional regulator, regulator of acetate metabolism